MMETSHTFISTFYENLSKEIIDVFPEYKVSIEDSLKFLNKELETNVGTTLFGLTAVGKALEKGVITDLGYTEVQTWAHWHIDLPESVCNCTALPRMLTPLVMLVFNFPSSNETEEGTKALAFQFLRQWYLAFSKVKDVALVLDETSQLKLFKDRLEDFSLPFEDEGGYINLRQQEFRREVLPLARCLLRHVFCDEGRTHPFLAQWAENPFGLHGSGAVYGREEGPEKWKLKAGRRISQKLMADSYGVLPNVSDEGRCDWNSRVCLVPKDLTKQRLICIEPKELMFAQQGIMAVLYQVIKTHPFLRDSIHITNQTYNFRKSRDERFCTIDLSDASDLISLKLVKYLLPKEVFAILTRYRASGIEFPDGSVVKPYRCFATMGNAICFPMESIVFWALSLAAILVREVSYRTFVSLRDVAWVLDHNPKPLLRRFSPLVFGDDIIVPRQAYDYVVDMLGWAGMRVNTSKSCGPQSPVRESCGSYWYRGFDVRIVKFKHAYVGSLPSLISLAEQVPLFEDLGFTRCKDFILSQLPPFLKPPSAPYSLGIKGGWLRVGSKYQRLEMRVPSLIREELYGTLNGRNCLYAYWTKGNVRPRFLGDAQRVKWNWVSIDRFNR
jgi:hypothetical protein